MNEEMPTTRQTMSYIKDLLRSRRLMPKAKMGQNFLIDLNLIDVIMQAAELTQADSVLEVGTGTGGLTGRLVQAAGAVTSVELDVDFHHLAKHLIGERPNANLIFGDILAGKNELRPMVVREWDRLTTERGCTIRKLVANLPYAVATPVIANLLISEIPIERMVVMVQWEMAERMVSMPGTKDYSSLAVMVQSLADVKVIRRLAPSNFWPPPAVDSAIVLVKPDPAKRAAIGDTKAYREFLRDLYTHRRKHLRVALSQWPGGKRDKAEIDAMLAELGIDGSVRAETLDVATHLRLWRANAVLEN